LIHVLVSVSDRYDFSKKRPSKGLKLDTLSREDSQTQGTAAVRVQDKTRQDKALRCGVWCPYRVCVDEHFDHWMRDLPHAGNVQRGPTVQIQRLRLRMRQQVRKRAF
jgi:hypothetical protein